jgi:hypothetical protein
MMNGINEYKGRLTSYEITGFRVWDNSSFGEHDCQEFLEEVSDDKADFFSLEFIGLKNSDTLFVDNFKTRGQAVNFANKIIKFSKLYIGDEHFK